ncbi:MAG: hypothetical protein J6S23_04550 [Clostridia bacterium]|nr:hypothetical protein [Clostridia bacterium]
MKNTNLKLNKTKLVARLMLVVMLIVLVIGLLSCKSIDPLDLEGYSSIDDDDWRLIREITPNPNPYVKNGYVPDIPPTTSNLWSALESIAYGDKTFYLARILKNNFYFLCGYENVFHPDWIYKYFRDSYSADIYDWYKVKNLENIESKIDSNKLRYVYIVFDCYIEEDIINEIDLNYYCKYYLKLDVNSIDGLNVDTLIQQDEILLLERPDINKQAQFPFYTKDDLGAYYWLYTNKEGKQYLATMDKIYGTLNDEITIISNPHEKMFEYYQNLHEYFEPLEELNKNYAGTDYNTSIQFEEIYEMYIGIDFETLRNISVGILGGE